MREILANLCHEQWSGWMNYLFSKCDNRSDGTVVIPKWAVDRWKKQINTEFSNLSIDEKDSDRKEADRFLKVING